MPKGKGKGEPNDDEVPMIPLQRRVGDEDLGESAPTNQAQPPRRMTRSMPQDTRLGQDSPATTLAPSLP